MTVLSCLVPPKSSFGVAVSGGSDSTALLLMAADLRRENGARCYAVTVDHGLRPEAAAEARGVRRICDQLDVPHTTLKWRRKTEGAVSQDEARLARHRLLAAWARKLDIPRIALGHTRDDRLETFLMRARQGSGWHGLAGPLPSGCSPVWPEGRGIAIIRPLLAFGREELRDELRARGADWIEDPSNESAKFERVRMRRLIARMDPRARDKALRVMDTLMTMRAAVACEAQSLLPHLQLSGDGREVSIPLTRRVTVGAEAWMRFVEANVMAAGSAERPPRRDALERLLERIDGGANTETALAGTTLAGAKIRVRRGALLAFSQAPPRRGMQPSLPADWSRAAMLLAPPDLRGLALPA